MDDRDVIRSLEAVSSKKAILIIVLVIVLLFGSAKIPQLMRGMGSGINEFKKGLKEGEKDAAKEKEEAYLKEFGLVEVDDAGKIVRDGAGKPVKASLVSREVIADSVELTMRGHCYDGLVGLAGCDKSLPGMMMAMVRLNVPSIFIYGGSILPGSYRGRQITVQDVFEAVGAFNAKRISAEEFRAIENHACPGEGACGGQFTANTMATAFEMLGISPMGLNGIPAPDPKKDEAAFDCGRLVMELLAKVPSARPQSGRAVCAALEEVPGFPRRRAGLRTNSILTSAGIGDAPRVTAQTTAQQIGFADTANIDPAEIRDEIFNALVEDWFYEAIEVRYDEYVMQRKLSLPTVKLETTFMKPTKMGETVDFWLTVSHLGRSSIRFTMGVDKDGDPWVVIYQNGPGADRIYRFDVASKQFVDAGGTGGYYRGMQIDREDRVWVAGNNPCRLILVDGKTDTKGHYTLGLVEAYW